MVSGCILIGSGMLSGFGESAMPRACPMKDKAMNTMVYRIRDGIGNYNGWCPYKGTILFEYGNVGCDIISIPSDVFYGINVRLFVFGRKFGERGRGQTVRFRG